ncbi:MAG: DUF5723 family protein [Bacteroidota bacterium]
MKKAILITGLLAFLGLAKAQFFPGLQVDNYGGINSQLLQPAEIAGSVIKLQISLGGLTYHHQGDMQGFNGTNGGRVEGKMLRMQPATLGQRKDLTYHINPQGYTIQTQQSISGPALSLSLRGGWGVGLHTRLRSFHEVENLPMDIFAALGQTGDSIVSNQRTDANNLRLKSLMFGEIGFSIGGVLLESPTHALKFGFRYKMLLGANGLYFQANNYEYEFAPNGNLRLYEIDALYGHSSRYYDGADSWTQDLGISRGWGGDLGFVYEYRPHAVRHSTGLWEEAKLREDETSYLLKVGLSILDMGSIQFMRSPNSEDFSRNAILPLVVDSLFPRPLSEIDTLISTVFDLDGGGSNMRMSLPSYVSLQLDYRLAQRIYLNALALMGPSSNSSVTPVGISMPSRYALTPRYEGKRFMLALPVSLLRGPTGSLTQAGVGLRLGPFSVASNNLFSAFANQNGLESLEAMMSVQFNLHKNKP